MNKDNKKVLYQRVAAAASRVLLRQQYVSVVDVLVEMGILQVAHLMSWRKGQVAYLERVIAGNLRRLGITLKCLREWAIASGLKPSETVYVDRTRDRRKLRFSASGDPNIEQAYRTHYISPQLTEQKRQRINARFEREKELVVFINVSDSACTKCHAQLPRGSFLYLETGQALCMQCSGFSQLVFVARGHAALTRRAKKYSAVNLVVVKFSRARKRYERQGLLVEEQALKQALESLKAGNGALSYLIK